MMSVIIRRTNVDKSHRAGIELEAGYRISKKLSLTGNLTLSENKIDQFNEYVYNYDVGAQEIITHVEFRFSFFSKCYQFQEV